MRKTLISLALAGLLISQGEVDFNAGGNGAGRYEKTASFVLTGEKKPSSPKTPVGSSVSVSPIAVQPKRVIRIPVTSKDIMPSLPPSPVADNRPPQNK